MEDTGKLDALREDIDLGESLAILRSNWWKIGGVSLAVGLLTYCYLLTQPNLYKASATITPSIEESKQNPALGAIASLGFQAGGPSKVEDLETLFKSNDLTARVFSKRDLWPMVLGERYDAKSGKMKPLWRDRLFGKTETKVPGEWDAIRAAKKGLTVAVNRRAGSISLSFEALSPQGSADIVRYYLDEAKNRLQEEALDRANKNKKFIEDQVAHTVDVLTRERLYAMLGQEMEKEMLAHNREQFVFRIVDAPRVPDRKTGPARSRLILLAIVAAVILASSYFLSQRMKKA